LLHRVVGCTIEVETIDHRPHDDAAPHELANVVANILIVSTKAVHPSDRERIACPQYVENPLAVGLSASGVVTPDILSSAITWSISKPAALA
jgi:hypothetical protein